MADKAKNPLSYAAKYWKSGQIKSDLEEPGKEGRAIGEKMKMAQEALGKPSAPPKPSSPAKQTTYPSDLVHPESNYKYGSGPGEKRIDTTEMTKPLGSFKDGGTVPKTGVYKLHKGEHVLTAENQGKMTHHAMALAGSVLGHNEPEKEVEPKKEVREMRIRKGKSGGHIIEHHHVHPMHPMEEHQTSDTDGLVEHVMHHMTPPNPGEMEAENGESAGTQAEEQMLGYK